MHKNVNALRMHWQTKGDPMNYIAFGKRVRDQRRISHITQEQLAEKAGVSLSFIGHIERGSRKASLETLVAIANALKISTDILLQDSLDDDLLGDSATQFSSSQRSMLHEIANVIRGYNPD